MDRLARPAELGGRFLDAVADARDRPAGFALPAVVDDRPAQAFGDPLRGLLIERLAGDGPARQARFRKVWGLCHVPDGRLLVQDGARLIRKITPAGYVTTWAF